MKTKAFVITFAGFVVILSMAIAAVIYELASVRDINMEGLVNKLYHEDSLIMSSVMSSIPPESYEKLGLPPSWAEIMTVDAADLTILASTNKENKGRHIYSLPGLLDQAKIIIEDMKSLKSKVIKAKEYTIVMVPYQNNRYIIGLKPKKWESDLIGSQLSEIDRASLSIYRNLVIFASIGVLLSLIFAYVISRLISDSVVRMFRCLEELSLGNLEAEPVKGKGPDMKLFSESFIRIRTSLNMAIERLKKR